MHNESIERILILGGGSAGWMSAAYLWQALRGRVEITLVESDRIGTIGVGESTIPTIRPVLFEYLGIPESEWMPACNATFKQGIKFINWRDDPEEHGENCFYHVFGESKEHNDVPLTHYWIQKSLKGFRGDFSTTCYPSPQLMEEGRSPKYLDDQVAVPYAYHFDANLVGNFLRDWAKSKGVRQVVDHVVGVQRTETGDIESVQTAGGQSLAADLFIDCSGFAGVLIERVFEEPFISFSDCLLCDTAIAMPIPHTARKLNPFTTATALKNGWVWDTPLHDRIGTGYVYSSQFTTPEKAEEELRGFLGAPSEGVEARHLRMRVGRRRNSWAGNCVSIGLASCFTEPLEATGLYFIYAALYHLVRYLPTKRVNPVLRAKFNERIAFMADDVRDFIAMHYCTTSRQDSEFWRANRHSLVISDELQGTLDEYRAGVPIKMPYSGESNYNKLIFDASFDRFWTNSNYLAILTGMGILPASQLNILGYRPEDSREVDRVLDDVAHTTATLLRELPSHREYIDNLNDGSTRSAAA
jgi:tryptophan halogenase